MSKKMPVKKATKPTVPGARRSGSGGTGGGKGAVPRAGNK